MITIDSIREPVLKELEAYEAFIERQFTSDGELLNEMLHDALSARGKGIRPLLVTLSAAMNARTPGAASGRRVSLAAMLVEMIHITSLIHDDVIDEADTRRGRPSMNARWQSHKAVLLGDYILARNLSIGLESGQFDLVSHICGRMATLAEGEILQSDCASKHRMTRSAYLDIIYKKTASLLGVSASAGAMAVGATRDKVTTMRRFGEALGMAFQIQDDLLDYTSDETGKPRNNDLREGKITLPLLVLLERADEARRTELLELLQACSTDERAVAELSRTVVEGEGITEAAALMQGYVARAVQLLAEFGESPYRTALVHLCSFVAERTR